MHPRSAQALRLRPAPSLSLSPLTSTLTLRTEPPPGPQISAYAYVLGMVAMLLALPHQAVLTSIWATTWQVSGSLEGGKVVTEGQRSGGAARPELPPWRPSLLEPAPPAHLPLCPAAFAQPVCSRSLPMQAGVAALGACMLFTLRGRISGRMSVLPSGGSAAALAGPKHH